MCPPDPDEPRFPDTKPDRAESRSAEPPGEPPPRNFAVDLGSGREEALKTIREKAAQLHPNGDVRKEARRQLELLTTRAP